MVSGEAREIHSQHPRMQSLALPLSHFMYLGLSLSSSGLWSWSDSLGGVVTMEWSNIGFYQISDVIMTYPYFYAIKKEEMLPE